MRSASASEAKTHLAALLDRVAKGETIEVTRRGVPVARLVPAGRGHSKDLKKVAREIRELRKGNRLGGFSIRKLVNEGRGRAYKKLAVKRPSFKQFLLGKGPSFRGLNLTCDRSPVRDVDL